MLQTGIERIVTENEKTDFLIFLRNSFYSKCFLAVLKTRAKYPEKVTLTLVIPEEDYRKNQTGDIPGYLIDRVVYPKQKGLNSSDYKNVIRWLIRQSTHLISCLYRTFYEQENHILDYAQSKEDLQIIDIANADTAQAILERTPRMSDRERFIFERLNDGSSPKEVAEAIGISRNRVAQVLNHGCRTLRESMRGRYAHLSAENRGQRKSVCSIFSAGTVTYESLNTFEYIVSFLLSRCGVTHFEVAAGDQHSGFMYVLKKHIESNRILCSTETIQTGINTEMIDGSDFCVCNLTGSPSAKEISEYILQTKHTVLVDMGQVYSQIQQALS